MSEINKIKLNDVEYDIEDSTAREDIVNIQANVANDLDACSLVVEEDKTLAGAYAVQQLNDSLGGLSFTYDESSQKYGYIAEVEGADTFFPFSGINEMVYLNSSPALITGVSATVDCSASDIDNYSYIIAVSSIGTRDTCLSVDISCNDEIIFKKSELSILCGQCTALIKPSGNSITVRTTTSINSSTGYNQIIFMLYGIK